MIETLTLKIGAIQKINFILDDHQKLINMCGMPDIIKHSLHKDIVTVKHILGNGGTENKGVKK